MPSELFPAAPAILGAGLSVVADPVPPALAEAIAWRHYRLRGRAEPLIGEKDSNFRLVTEGGGAVFLKVLSPGEDPAVSRMHGEALRHVERVAPDLPLPRILPVAGAPDLRLEIAPGDWRVVRVTTFCPGRAQSDGPRGPRQRRRAGALLARLQAALATFEHPAADHPSSWDMRGVEALRPLLALFDGAARARLTGILDRYAAEIAPRLADLPFQVVHNDLNGDNVLVDPADPDRITGVIDFGDMVRTARLFDIAIACAYQMEDRADPLAPAHDLLAGVAEVTGLSPAEQDLLLPAIETRMAMRILIPEWRAGRYPDRRDYITRNSPAVWAQLARLDALPRGEIAARLRVACEGDRA